MSELIKHSKVDAGSVLNERTSPSDLCHPDEIAKNVPTSFQENRCVPFPEEEPAAHGSEHAREAIPGLELKYVSPCLFVCTLEGSQNN